jgi:formylglycine-generating enzyme
MPDHEDSLGGETFSGEEQQDPAEQSLGDGATMGGDTAAHSLGDQSTFGDTNVDDELFDDGMKLEDLSERYTEEGVLGKGGFGEVILATDNRLERKVAIKRIQGKAARSKTAVQRFLTEAKSIAALSHNNIVQIYDYGRSTDGPFLIMECVQGGSLLDLCRKGPIELDEAVRIFSQVCDGLAKAHAQNIIHRDIKPANILMTEDGIPKLTDFGLAKDDTADTGKTIEGAVIGTLDFMPPEQRKGAEFTDHRSDLWSLAATFYQMLTGEPPRVIDLDLLPPAIRTVLAKALKSKMEDRFQSAVEMREAILQSYSGKMDTSRTLTEGECPQCATSNPSRGKFCVGCGAILQVQCLQCEAEIQIWNRACGECGSLQEPLVEKALADLKQIHDEAESLLAELEFDAAEEKAAVIPNETDSRLQQFAPWHEDFSARLESSRTSEHARLAQLLQEALVHEQAYDYEAGLQTLKQVAPSLKQTTVGGSGCKDTTEEMTKRLTTKQSRLKELKGIVRERVTKREIAGLLPIVDELSALKPDRPELQKLRAQLATREDNLLQARDTAIKQAAQQLSEQQYAEAVATLNAVSKEVSHGPFEDLKSKANDLLNQLNNLRDQITGAISDNQFAHLLPVVEQCLALKPDQDEIIKLKQDLIARETRLDASNQEIISRAQMQLQQGQFDAAAQILDTIATEQQTSSTLSFSQEIAAGKAAAVHAAVAKGDWKVVLSLDPGNREGLRLKAVAPITNTIDMTFNYIPAGTFTMGSPETEEGRIDNEQQHPVTISKAFYMQTTVVTQWEWNFVMGMGNTPWKDQQHVKEGPNNPASRVSWNDAVAYCKKLSEKEGKTYRLPTEAEWESACRAGTTTAYSFGDDEYSLGDYAWYVENTKDIGEGYAHQVGLKKPNAFGLYDMHGNVSEWCQDYYGEDYYIQSPEKDPTGPASGSLRVLRGGSWFLKHARLSRSAFRGRGGAVSGDDWIGFRLVRELD